MDGQGLLSPYLVRKEGRKEGVFFEHRGVQVSLY